MTALLSLQNISKRFPGVLALDDIDMELRQHEVLGLIGQKCAHGWVSFLIEWSVRGAVGRARWWRERWPVGSKSRSHVCVLAPATEGSQVPERPWPPSE